MKLETLVLPNQNKVMQSYNNDKEFIHTYFDYENKDASFQERLNELSERTFKRSELANVIRSYMEPFGVSELAEKHIAELAADGVAVVGGQQAGLLTGPLYSVHKAISVILLAKKQREDLGIPVIPVFWVAGEDHDLNEINHVHTVTDQKVTKNQYREKYVLKLMASDASYEQERMSTFVKEIFGTYGETAYTKDLLNDVLAAVAKEETFTGFFVRLMNGLFQEEGLLFLDAAYGPLRKLESEYFTRLILGSDKIAQVVLKKEERFAAGGFGHPIEVQADGAHLFYVHETGRVLLSKENGDFINDSVGIRFTEEELLEIARKNPRLLSNNVVTRPIMQDFVFPVLAFIGGPGEIAYWAILKEAFHHLHMKMPIIVPRMSLTLVTARTAQALQTKSFTVEDVMAGKVIAAREQEIDELRDDRLNLVVDETMSKLKGQYEEIRGLLEEQDLKMDELLKKNVGFHSMQFEYLKEKVEDAFLLKHDTLLRKYGEMESELYPEGSLQERLYTPFAYLNNYGPTLIKDLLRLPYKMDGTHKIIYL
ncbi:bacillithiol biosynthesis cysteine-adding enzyme BshC [Sporosarcina sp. G11-34]|uniref:bacillithiol biosynthesis cysteine-adding enzyme BshC n=1 Tax=Sporosarcina sp. G11-34 TaxID=2849605 RepID=UPI0022A9D074|nr:bacillithiol biosynthesis cysteine-adding enzyme BshC [Sporosarcina sp. G11-34]MCZ2258879.1 bacillithiol biosynthesis cysteine-adding enzyme BshC [Sporosarcina sp. G11-34]